MRIIHEITSPMQVMASIDPYTNVPGIKGWNGGRCSILMCTSPGANLAEESRVILPEDDEVIEIEGGLEYVLDALRSVVEMLEANKNLHRERLGPQRRTTEPSTWEERAAAGDQYAARLLQEDPTMKDVQQAQIDRTLERAKQACPDCGGPGCPKCDWIGKVQPAPPAESE